MQTIRNALSFRDQASHLISRLQGISVETDLAPYLTALEGIRAFDISSCSDAELKDRSHGLKRQALDGESLELLLPEAFALVAEVSARTTGLKPFDVQILAAVVLHQGKLAQMQTGEGKTLVAVFPAYLNALTGKGVHVMTANDYLARRDAHWMAPIYRFLGLEVGVVQENSKHDERGEAYLADITYLTAKEAGFDLLRDQLSYSREELVQRSFHYAIVDEADFILVDEARVPLVIAGHSPPLDVDPHRVEEVMGQFQPGEDFRVESNQRNVHLTLHGQDKVQRLLDCGGMHEEQHRLVYAAVNVALHAHYLLKRDVDYIVRDARIELVDEFTGRVADRRRWPYGIQSALEAKEGLEVHPEGLIYGSITIQHLMNLYPKLSAMTATAISAAAEFSNSYGLDTVIVPPHRACIRVDVSDKVFASMRAKMAAIVEEVRAVHATGRPILVGTSSVKESQSLAQQLRGQGIPCQVLNAGNDEREAEIVARAGKTGAVTISTNMAGRGTDIKLGGEELVDAEAIRRLGGLYVIGINRHESVRIDNQLRGRAGRQGDPGSSCFFISLEDELIQRYGVREFIPARYLRVDSHERIVDRRVSAEIVRAQRIIEGQNHEIRNNLRKYAELVERQRKIVHALRRAALLEGMIPEGVRERCSAHFRNLSCGIGEQRLENILVRTFLIQVDRFWADHLLFVDEVREGIQLQRLGGEQPLLHFIRSAGDAFASGLEEVERFAANRFNQLDPSVQVDALEAVLEGPSVTWTYQINDDPLPSFLVGIVGTGNIGFASLAAALLAVPMFIASALLALTAVFHRIFKTRSG